MERLGALDLPWVMLALRRLIAVAGVMGMILSLMVWGCCLDGLRVKEIRELSALGLKTSFFSLFGLYSKGLPRLQTLV